MDKSRPHVGGKWLMDGDGKSFVKSVGYGPFAPDKYKNAFPSPDQVYHDLRAMSERGFNTVRTFDLPPDHLVASASLLGLRLLVGIPWEQHTTFLDEAGTAGAIRRSIFGAARLYAGEACILGMVLGDRIPESIVRWHGPRKVASFLRSLHDAVKAVDPAMLTTYVNNLSGVFLDLPFLDFHIVSAGVADLDDDQAILRMIQTRIGGSPVMVSEAGIDSRLVGVKRQAAGLSQMVTRAVNEACSGIDFRTWSDDALVDGRPSTADFGLVTRERTPKPSLFAVGKALRRQYTPILAKQPFVTVVVTTHNGAKTIGETLEHLCRLDYPCYEVIVVDDGSNDDTWSIAKDRGVRVITSDQPGEASARNTGVLHAAGEIVAFVDDNAYPDRDWLTFVINEFARSSCAAVAGPCLVPKGDGLVSQCVAVAPGHSPAGSNIAFDRSALKRHDLFDVRFTMGSSEVDLLWRLGKSGQTIEYCPGAVVWKHSETSVSAYWKREFDYGRAEALLEQYHPDQFTWLGKAKSLRPTFGHAISNALFDEPASKNVNDRTTARADGAISPEWMMASAVLGLLSLIGLAWWPLLFALPLFAGLILVPIIRAIERASGVTFSNASAITAPTQVWMRILTTLLYLVQPVARLAGRTKFGLTAWRHRGLRKYGTATRQFWQTWTARNRASSEWLDLIEKGLEDNGALTARGGSDSRWDLHVRGGLLAATRLKLVVEGHGAGRNLVRLKYWPRYSPFLVSVAVVLSLLILAAASDHSVAAAGLIALLTIALAGVATFESGRSAGAVASVLAALALDEERLFESRLASTFDAPVRPQQTPAAADVVEKSTGDGASEKAVPAAEPTRALPEAAVSKRAAV